MGPLRFRVSRTCLVLSVVLPFAGCGGSLKNNSSQNPATVSVQLAQPPGAIQAGAQQQFTAIVQGTTNTAVNWSVDTVPSGNAAAGTISAAGLYTAPASVGSHTITATSVVDPTKSASAAVTVFEIAVSPGGVVLAPGATQQFTANVQGLTSTAVTWAVDGNPGGSSAAGTITANGLYTASAVTGGHTVTATIVGNTSASGSTIVNIVNVNPGSVLTYHNDDARDGVFSQEIVLSPPVVNSSSFGKLRSYTVDGQIYAQPLFIPQLAIGGQRHNVVFAATENDSVYAFDADGLQSSPLWSKNLGTPSPRQDAEGVSPSLGITSTPVIDITTGTMYLVAQTTSGPYLHALDITSGAEKLGGPVWLGGSVPGSGADSNGGAIQLEYGCYQRAGLALSPVSKLIYIGFGHCPHGWLLAYNKTSLQQKAIFNDTPDGAGGGFWNSGGAPVIDDRTGDVFVMTGVDLDDPSSGYNDAFLRLGANDLSVLDYFQPDNAAYLALNDADLGSGSPVLMPDNGSSTPHEIIGGGKDGNVFVVNRDGMGSFSPAVNNVIETIHTGVHQFDNIFSTPAYWNGLLYYHCEGDVLRAFSWSNGQLSTASVAAGQPVLNVHGATVSISSNGTSNGIAWEIDNSNYGNGGAAVLRAYDASNVSDQLYDSTQAGSRDQAGTALKFTVPTVADGLVFVGTADELDIYGLLGK